METGQRSNFHLSLSFIETELRQIIVICNLIKKIVTKNNLESKTKTSKQLSLGKQDQSHLSAFFYIVTAQHMLQIRFVKIITLFPEFPISILKYS